MVDRAQPGAGGDQQRQSERGCEGADVELLGDRHEQSADPLDDEYLAVGGQGLSALEDRGGVDRPTGELGGEVRRDGRTVRA